MRLLRIYFVEGENRFTKIFRKTFQLCFNNSNRRLTYVGCFCHQDYPSCFIESNNKIVKSFKALKAPTIIVAKQNNFFKTLNILIHELGHYIIWLLFYWNKPIKLEKKIRLKRKPKLYSFFTDWYDRIYRQLISTDNIYV